MVADLVEDLARLLADGVEALTSCGDLTASRRHFEAAYEVAAQAGNHEAMAVAALGIGGLWVHEDRGAVGSAGLLARLGDALSRVDPTSPTGVRLRARLAGETDYRLTEHANVLAVLDEARQLADPVTLADTLSIAHHCLLGPDHGVPRRALAADLLAESTHTRRQIDVLMGMLWETVDLFLDGDTHGERRLRELRALLFAQDHLAVGFVVQAIEVMLTIRSGDLDRAEQMSRECAERGRQAGDVDAETWHSAQLVAIRWYQGRITELLPTLQDLVNSPDFGAVDNSLFAALAVAAATHGDLRTASGAIARLCGRDLAELPRSSTWLVTMNGVVEAAHLLRDVDTSAQAYDLLLPYADLPMMASLAIACFGSVHHVLGVAALTMGRADDAVDHFQAAVRQNLALAHWPAVMSSRLRHAQALSARGVAADTRTARQEPAVANTPVRRLDGADPGRGPVDPPYPRAAVVRQGKSWTIGLGHRSVTVSHSVGLLHLAVLIANPGQEVKPVDLVAGVSVLSRARAAVSAQVVLDRTAIRNYRDRLEHLNSELDEWEGRGTGERADRARAERDWILGQLAGATGIKGDSRSFADSGERARIAVGKAIRRALARIAEADPVIGAHLRRSVHTGVHCSYRPL